MDDKKPSTETHSDQNVDQKEKNEQQGEANAPQSENATETKQEGEAGSDPKEGSNTGSTTSA